MGNADSKNLDKRSARREHHAIFDAAIEKTRQCNPNNLSAKRSSDKTPLDSEIIKDLHWEQGDIRVCVRKRPLFKHEVDVNEFDVISCLETPVGSDSDKMSVIVHDARLHNDCKSAYISHYQFPFDCVFHEDSTNDTVYKTAAHPLLAMAMDESTCLHTTCMVYGMTGSGKSFTMTSIYEYTANDIFMRLATLPNKPVVYLSYIEIAGDVCKDLLTGSLLPLIGDVDGSSSNIGTAVHSKDELLALIEQGKKLRATASTEANDGSSRSHSIVRIRFRFTTEAGELKDGMLNLVDLAGSEFRTESMHHSAERRKECAEINTSLMALKDCLVARSKGENFQHNYRKSKLTMALKTSFTLEHNKTVIIATVSPASKDTEHSLNTLRHAAIMDGQQSDTTETRFLTGGICTKEDLGTLPNKKSIKAVPKVKEGEEVICNEQTIELNKLITQCEAELQDPSVSDMKKYGTKKQLAKHRAALLKIQREGK